MYFIINKQPPTIKTKQKHPQNPNKQTDQKRQYNDQLLARLSPIQICDVNRIL